MKPSFCVSLLIIVIAHIFFVRCSKSNNGSSEENIVRIKNVEGIIPENISMQGRDLTNWNLSLNNYSYSVQYNNSTIAGAPSHGEGTSSNNLYSILFAPKDYWNGGGAMPMVKELQRAQPYLRNQDKFDSLVWSDMLFAHYDAKINLRKSTQEISGLHFVHANALYDFQLNNFPNDVIVKVVPKLPYELSVYKYGNNQYQCIVPGSWWHIPSNNGPVIIVYVNNVKYSIEIKLDKTNTYYRFTLIFDAANKNVLIGDIKETVWSDEKWPNY